MAAWAPTSSAVVAGGPNGRVSYLPLNESTPPSTDGPRTFTFPTGAPPLEWHGGPVMTSHEAFAIFWSPSDHPFPSGYRAAITQYFEDVAGDSELPTNVYSVSAQYFGSNGQVSYEDSFGGSVLDTTPYPSSGTCPTYTGINGASYSVCITDTRIEEEVEAVVENAGWPSGLGAAYYVVLPPEVGSCISTSGSSPCFDKQFCAYHSFVSSADLVYANISYAPEDTSGCGVDEYPHGFVNGLADDTFSSISHEANESITDPELNAWFDEEGLENGDECRNTPFGEDFGPALGGSLEDEDLFNQSIDGSPYYLQQEWSNDIGDCAQRVGPAKPLIVAPASAGVGQTIEFDGSESVPGDGGIEGYAWSFGDGSEGEGEFAAHAYSAPGSYTVTLTVFDDGGFAYSKSRQLTVTAPSPPPGGGGSGGTVQVVFPAAASTSSSSAPPSAHASGIAVAAGTAKVSRGVAGLKVKCHGGGSCSGMVRLLDRGVLGSAHFILAAGATKILRVHLTTRGISLLTSSGSLKVSLAGTGVRHRTLTLSLIR
jgi:hypothetical protein